MAVGCRGRRPSACAPAVDRRRREHLRARRERAVLLRRFGIARRRGAALAEAVCRARRPALPRFFAGARDCGVVGPRLRRVEVPRGGSGVFGSRARDMGAHRESALTTIGRRPPSVTPSTVGQRRQGDSGGHAWSQHTPSAFLGESLTDVAGRSPHAVAIDVPGQDSVSYADLTKRIDSAIAHYRALGLAEADRVALISPPSVQTVVALLALSRIVTVVPLNPAYTSAELRSYLEAARADALVVADDSAVEDHLAELSLPIVRPATAGALRAEFPRRTPAERAPALLFQTSGTTARPKNVPPSHRNVLAGVANVIQAVGLTAADSCLVMMPIHHVHGLIGCALATLLSGGRLILPATPRAVEAFGWLTTESPTWYSGSPATHRSMIARARAVGVRPRHALRLIRSASAPLPGTLIQELRDLFGAPVVNAYGMTEGSHQIASTSLDGCEQEGDVGFAVGCEVMARRDDGSRADADEVEEIWIKGENVTAGYEPPDANIDADGWLRTGDVGIGA